MQTLYHNIGCSGPNDEGFFLNFTKSLPVRKKGVKKLKNDDSHFLD